MFAGPFRMSHQIPFGAALRPGEPNVPLPKLLLTALQIVHLGEKDVAARCCCSMATRWPAVTTAPSITAGSRLCAEDWASGRISDRAGAVQQIKEAPKSRG
jgi:hypothetical protein